MAKTVQSINTPTEACARHLRPGERAYAPASALKAGSAHAGACDALQEACRDLGLGPVELKWWAPVADDSPIQGVEVHRRCGGWITDDAAGVINLSTELEGYAAGFTVALHEARHLWQKKWRPWLTTEEGEADARAYASRMSAPPIVR